MAVKNITNSQLQLLEGLATKKEQTLYEGISARSKNNIDALIGRRFLELRVSSLSGKPIVTVTKNGHNLLMLLDGQSVPY